MPKIFILMELNEGKLRIRNAKKHLFQSMDSMLKNQPAHSVICKRFFGFLAAAATAILKQISHSKDLKIAFSHSMSKRIYAFVAIIRDLNHDKHTI